MGTVATDFGIKGALEQLGVKAVNEGTSTGSENFSNGVYFAKLIINNQQAGLKKLVLMK